jgi:hypothetical protein
LLIHSLACSASRALISFGGLHAFPPHSPHAPHSSLFSYAEAARNEENLLYLIAVKQYMQLKTKNQKRDMAKTILQTYCVDNSKLEICIPGSVRPRFVSALKALLAGKSVNMTNLFAAQALSAQKDALRDLQPRFLAGSFYKRFMRFSALSQADGIIVPSPQRFADPALIKELHSNGALGTHQVILDYADVYALFLEFCTSRHCEENVLVLMALNGLDEYIRREDYEQAEALAWHIYHHYVDPSSVHAVTIDEMAIWTFTKHIPKPNSGMVCRERGRSVVVRDGTCGACHTLLRLVSESDTLSTFSPFSCRSVVHASVPVRYPHPANGHCHIQWAVLEEQARLGIKSAMTQFMSWDPWRMYVRATASGARGSFRMCSGGRGSSAAVQKRRLSVALQTPTKK